MANEIVEGLKKIIGQELTESPSGVSRFLRGTLLSVEEGSLEAEFVVREDMTNPLKILHGGAIALIMDDMIGATVYTLPTPVHYVSVNLDVAFYATARLNDKIIAKAQIVKQGRNFIHAECVLLNQRDQILAKCQSGLVSTGIKKQ